MRGRGRGKRRGRGRRRRRKRRRKRRGRDRGRDRDRGGGGEEAEAEAGTKGETGWVRVGVRGKSNCRPVTSVYSSALKGCPGLLINALRRGE